MNKKIIIGIIVGVLAVGGTFGVVMGVKAYNASQEEKKQAELMALGEAIKKSQEAQFNAFNERIAQTVAGVDVNNVDALNNVINALNSVIVDINADTIITPEQKNALSQAATEQINAFNAQIQSINAQAEAQAQAQAEVEANAKAQASNSKASSSSSKSSGKSSSRYSGGSSNTYSGGGSSNDYSSGGDTYNGGGEAASAPAPSTPKQHHSPTEQELAEGAKRTAEMGLAG